MCKGNGKKWRSVCAGVKTVLLFDATLIEHLPAEILLLIIKQRSFRKMPCGLRMIFVYKWQSLVYQSESFCQCMLP
jgi:hypothetical protein